MLRIFVSDIHMGAGRSLDPETGYDWLKKKEADNFAGFLAYLKKQKDVEEVILLGDTMDNWVCPVDDVPPTFDDILQAPHNKNIVDNLSALSQSKRVVFMPGNHDMHATEQIINRYFPKIAYGGSAFNKSRYRTSRLLAEHGSAYAMFNAPDPMNNPANRLPLGYFIARLDTTIAQKTGSSRRHYWTYFDDMLESLGPQKIAASVFEAVLEEAGLDENSVIVMGVKEGKEITMEASMVKERYANLYDQWQSNYGSGMAFKAVMAEIGYLGDLADHLSKKGDTKIIIFGHSHDSELDKDSWFVEDRIYANCGTWCDEKKGCTFVETERNEAHRKYTIRLKQWANKAVSTIGEEEISY
jgi:UDP-2,3-diacylglucosamine pyrophosphatase LpxH